MIKAKKRQNGELDRIAIPQKQRGPSTSGVTKRKETKQNNKENNVQITEPMEIIPSKEFVLSRESITRGTLRQIPQNQNTSERLTFSANKQDSSGRKEREKQRERQREIEREQELFDRRLSLKCATNFSQQLDSQKSHRLSVAPMRRESLGGAVPQSLLEERDSMSSYYQNSVVRSEQKVRQGRQAIITNFMQKLDHQQDLRTIIESKLRNAPSSTCFSKDRRNQSYITDFTEDPSAALSAKLKNCEAEIKYFKNAVKELSQRIVELTADKGFRRKGQQGRSQEEIRRRDEGNGDSKGDLVALLRQLGSACSPCGECGRRAKKESREIGVQTISEQAPRAKMNESFDFFDNLEKTLKVLDGKKN